MNKSIELSKEMGRYLAKLVMNSLKANNDFFNEGEKMWREDLYGRIHPPNWKIGERELSAVSLNEDEMYILKKLIQNEMELRRPILVPDELVWREMLLESLDGEPEK
jgi:hypothetical protein